MDFIKNRPLIVAPFSNRTGGIGTWTKNMLDYSATEWPNSSSNIHTYANNLKNITNTNSFARIITGLVLYSKLFFEILLLCRKYKPTVLHITSSASIGLIKDIMLIWSSKLLKIPVILHWRFGRIPSLYVQKNWEWKLMAKVLTNSSACIVIDLKSFTTLLDAGFQNIWYIPNPIGLVLEQESRKLPNLNIQKLNGKIIFVGHIIRKKGVFELVEICAGLEAVEELLLIGPYEEALKKELIKIASVKANGMWLKFTGALPNEKVWEQMRISPVLVLPSYTEGCPNVILEAMAMGCAVIATNVGAIPEMLAVSTDKPCGICIPVRDIEKLRDAILTLFEDTERRQMLGNNGRDRVLENYTLKKVMVQYESVWSKAILSK